MRTLRFALATMVSAAALTQSRVACADITHVTTRDVSLDPAAASLPAGNDAFPALAGTTSDGVWLAWARIPANPQLPASLVAARANGLSTVPSYLQFPVGPRVTGVAIAHDGTEPLVFYSPPVAVATGGTPNILAWLPRNNATPVVFSGLTNDPVQLTASDFGNAANFDIAFATLLAPQVTTVRAQSSAGYPSFTSPGRTYPGQLTVSAARSLTADVSIYAMAGNTPAFLVADRDGGNVATLLTATPLSLSVAPTTTGAFQIAVLTTRSAVTLFDTTGPGVMPVPSSVIVLSNSNVAFVANAPHFGGGGMWTVALSHAPPTLWVRSETTPEFVSFPLEADYTECAPIEAASTPAFPNAVFVSGSCTYQNGPRHVLLSVFREPPAVEPDAGTDAAVDAATNDVEVDVNDTNDATTGDGNVPTTTGTGPTYRGSGCACRTSVRLDGNASSLGSIALALLLVSRTRRRESRRRRTASWA